MELSDKLKTYFPRLFRQYKKRNLIVPSSFRRLNHSFLVKFAVKFGQQLRNPVFKLFTSVFSNALGAKGLKYNVTMYHIGNSNLSAKVMGAFAIRKLKSNNRLNSIFYPFIRGLKPFFLGLRVYCAGRFTRAQRASFKVYWFGKVSLNKFSYPIDYYLATVPLKFGVGSMKIWLARRKRKTRHIPKRI